MSVVWPIVVLFMFFFLCSGFISPTSPLICFITVLVAMCVSQSLFSDQIDDPCTDWTFVLFVIWRYVGFECEVLRINWFRSPGVFLLTVPGRLSFAVLLCSCVSGFVHDVCIVLVCCKTLLLLVPREGLCFMIVAFPIYLYIHFTSSLVDFIDWIAVQLGLR